MMLAKGAGKGYPGKGLGGKGLGGKGLGGKGFGGKDFGRGLDKGDGKGSGKQAKWSDVVDEGEIAKDTEVELVDSFDDLDLEDGLLRGIYAYGFEKPTATQQRALKPVIDGKDTICQAEYTTARIAAYAIGALHRIDVETRSCQALILAPARELAVQILEVIQTLGDYLKVRAHLCIGGAPVQDDISQLQRGQHIVVGTPGRVFDMITKKHLKLECLSTFVLDEAEDLLASGFKNQLYEVFRALPADVSACVFSSAFSAETLDLLSRVMRQPVRILHHEDALTLQKVKEFYVNSAGSNKIEILVELLGSMVREVQRAIIYVNTREAAADLAEQLLKTKKFSVAAVHGGLDREQTQRTLKEFSSDSIGFLITTDLMLCRMDTMKPIRLVINFDLPGTCVSYLRRVGRSCLNGKGIAISLLATSSESGALKDHLINTDQIETWPPTLAFQLSLKNKLRDVHAPVHA